MKVTARKQPNEQGLSRVTQSPRGYIVKRDGVDVGYVSASRSFLNRFQVSWYWYAHVGQTSRNSAAEGDKYETKEDALSACMAWVRAQP